MHRKIFIDQLKRSKKTVVYFWLLLIAATFFVTSMNLYYNSTSNLQLSENTFSTLAVTELCGEVDRYGELVERNSDAHIGYQAVGVKGYDIAPILQSDAVESYDLRSQYGAYIEACPVMGYAPQVSGDGTETRHGICKATMSSAFGFGQRSHSSWSIIHTTSIIHRHCRLVWRSLTTLPAALPIPIPCTIPTWDLSQRSGKCTRRTSKPSTKPKTPTA